MKHSNNYCFVWFRGSSLNSNIHLDIVMYTQRHTETHRDTQRHTETETQTQTHTHTHTHLWYSLFSVPVYTYTPLIHRPSFFHTSIHWRLLLSHYPCPLHTHPIDLLWLFIPLFCYTADCSLCPSYHTIFLHDLSPSSHSIYIDVHCWSFTWVGVSLQELQMTFVMGDSLWEANPSRLFV